MACYRSESILFSLNRKFLEKKYLNLSNVKVIKFSEDYLNSIDKPIKCIDPFTFSGLTNLLEINLKTKN
jgi:hypothetical protein